MRTPTNRFPGQGKPRDASDRQFDIFKAKERSAEWDHSGSQPRQVACDELDDSTLVAALTRAGIRDCVALAAEAGQRRLATAIPTLDTCADAMPVSGLSESCLNRPPRSMPSR